MQIKSFDQNDDLSYPDMHKITSQVNAILNMLGLNPAIIE